MVSESNWHLLLCGCHHRRLESTYTFLEIRLGVCLSGICARSPSLRMDAQIEINEYNRGRLWCAVHTCAHIKLYYLNTTCHAACTHPNGRSDVFISTRGLRSSLRLSLVHGEGWCPRRDVCLRPTLRPWCFFQTRPGPENADRNGLGTS